MREHLCKVQGLQLEPQHGGLWEWKSISPIALNRLENLTTWGLLSQTTETSWVSVSFTCLSLFDGILVPWSFKMVWLFGICFKEHCGKSLVALKFIKFIRHAILFFYLTECRFALVPWCPYAFTRFHTACAGPCHSALCLRAMAEAHSWLWFSHLDLIFLLP